jgi:hypothetical protein
MVKLINAVELTHFREWATIHGWLELGQVKEKNTILYYFQIPEGKIKEYAFKNGLLIYSTD